ncbi:MAG TPA: acyl-CoA dehydrogenase family protein, partial [Candidatus Dormibacteraeota bacterium]
MDDGLTEEVRDLRASMRRFLDDEVIPREAELLDRDGGGRGLLDELKAAAKAEGLWALGHPREIGCGGLPFMPFVYLNEVIGRSEFGQLAVGTVSMQDSIMLHLHASEEQRRRWLAPLVAGDI